MAAVLGNGAGGFHCGHATQGAVVDVVAYAHETAFDEVFLHRLAHFQQYAGQVDLMSGSQRRLGQFHYHQRITVGIVLHGALAQATDDLARGILRGWQGLHFPVARPGDHQVVGHGR